MGKSMARIKDGIVTNIEWCSDDVLATEYLIDIEDRIINIGNTYIDGKFYDDGIEVLTEKESLYKLVEEYWDEKESLYKLVEEYSQELAVLDEALLEAQYQNLIGGL